MKKMLLLLTFLITITSKGQITLEHTFSDLNDQTKFMYINIGDDDYKYVLVDYLNSKFDIYNLDYTPYLLNIYTAAPLSENDISYISKSLFDCDASTVEYVLIQNFSNFRVYQSNGTLIFNKNNVLAEYCYGCNNGSVELKPIYNTPDGTKLILRDTNNNSTFIYNLCGSLPLGINDFSEKSDLVTLYPIPTNENGRINFKIDIPDYMENNEIEIYDLKMQLIDKFKINDKKTIITKEYNFSTGTYLYVLRNSGKVIKTGKFMLK